MLFAFLIAGAVAGTPPAESGPPAPPPAARKIDIGGEVKRAARCDSGDPDAIVVCGGRGNDQYRIDPSTLAAMRAREAKPPKPPVTADASPQRGCVGPMTCQGDTFNLVSVALAAAKVAVLAAKGEDWRQALRSKPDEYKLYQEAEERRRKERKVRVGVGMKR